MRGVAPGPVDTAMAKAVAVCDEGQPQKIPPRMKPKRKMWLVSVEMPWGRW